MKQIFVIAVALAAVGCWGRKPQNGAAEPQVIEVPATPAPPAVRYKYNVAASYPHSTDAYTQGFLWHDGAIYEGTGQKGESRIREVDLTTGKARREHLNAVLEFGEGIAIVDTLLYQITWTDGICYVYDVRTFKQVNKFHYSGEGWGLTTDGQKLYMSDGTDKIFIRRTSDFAVEKIIHVTVGQNAVNYINELEWINGEIWANVYTSNFIVRIEPATGHVVGIIDLSGIQSERDITSHTDVLNGIAYDPATGRIWVTGKYWNKVYEITIDE